MAEVSSPPPPRKSNDHESRSEGGRASDFPRRPSRSKGWIALLVLLLAGGGGAAYLASNAPKAASKGGTAVVKRQPLRIVLLEEGTLTPYETNDVKIKQNEQRQLTVKWVVPNGTTVRKGEKVLELDPSLLDREVRKAKLEVQSGENELLRAKEELKKAKSDLEINVRDAEFKVEIAEKDLKRYVDLEEPKNLAELKMKIERTKTLLEEAKQNLDSAKDLFKQDLVAEFEVRKNQTAHKEAEFNVSSAGTDLELFTKHSNPINHTRFRNALADAQEVMKYRRSFFGATISQRESEVNKAEQTLDEHRDRLRKLEEDLGNVVLTAPIDGTIHHGMPRSDNEMVYYRQEGEELKEGGKVSSGRVLMYIPDLSRMYLRLQIDEVDIAKLIPREAATPAAEKADDAEIDKPKKARNFSPLKVLLRTESYRDDPLTGEIEYVAGAAAKTNWYEDTTKFETKAKINESRPWFRPGMKAKAEILVDDVADALAVPIDALFKKEGKDLVYAMKEGRPEAREVRTGRSNNDLVEILSGLAEGETVTLYDPGGK